MVVDLQIANFPGVVDSTPLQQVQQPVGGGSSSVVGTSASVASVWQRPLSGRYKCNIDAAFSSHFNRTGIGICVRDSEGTFVLAKVVSYPCCYSVDVGEALGLYTALQWLSDMQFDNVDFETDSKLTCDAFLLLETTILSLDVLFLHVAL